MRPELCKVRGRDPSESFALTRSFIWDPMSAEDCKRRLPLEAALSTFGAMAGSKRKVKL